MALLRRHWLELAWALFAVVNVAVLLRLEAYETIPFHFVWVSLALLYCVRPWPPLQTAIVLGLVMAVTAVALGSVVVHEGAGYDELAEVPLMAAMYVVIVWYAHRWQRAMEASRRSAERERDFIRDASHALRTPVTVALGHAELARRSSDEQTREDLDVVLDELKRVSTISDRLILLAAATHRNFVEGGVVDVGHLLQTVAKRWTGTAPREWMFLLESEGTIDGDEERLALALDCLVENALKATSDGDEISVVGRVAGEVLVLEVSDSGVGIDSDDQARIFERFSRANRTNGRASSGTGLGLAIVKAIAQAHGGTVEVESEPGRGATFRIRLLGFRRETTDSMLQTGTSHSLGSRSSAPGKPALSRDG